jgi:DNA polymerase-3 subunit gamma/tau
MVFYRKYRPQKIDDLDSASVRETLHAVLQRNIPHAFLFTGPKGLGKTSTARIVAKVVNCERIGDRVQGTDEKKKKLNPQPYTLNPDIEPCNKCDQCVSITNGTNVDILEIDAASNRGIDEIRELKEKIRLAPVAAKRKVYIIDEVHMLTTEAFNALLKTLEEPPEHAMFILCTTEAHKVPETIVSRCFQIMFRPATEEELVRSFKRIVEGEKLEINDEALKYIANLAERGFRDGVKILEELVSLSGNEKITIELIEAKYHISTAQLYINRIENVFVTRDTKEGLEIIKKMVEQGFQLKDFVAKLMESLHGLLMYELGIGVEEEKNVGLSINEIKTLMELFSNAYTEMKTAVIPQLPLELAVIEWCEDLQHSTQAQNYAKQNSAGAGLQPDPERSEASYKLAPATNQTVIPAKVLDARMGAGIQNQNGSLVKPGMTNEEDGVSVSSLRKQVGTIKKLKALYGEKKKEPDVEIEIETTSVELLQTNGNGPVTKEWMELFWKNLISEMKKYNHTVAGVLRGCTIKSYADHTLVIQTAYKFHKERLDDMKNREALLKISKLLTGKDVAITVELKGK